MKKQFLLFIFLFISTLVSAQATSDYAIQLTATVQVSPPKITLNWKPLSDTPNYTVYRKAKSASSWGTALTMLPYTASSYTDSNVVADSAYEYYIEAQGTTTVTTPINSTGFIYAGIMAPAIHNRGALIVLVDSTFVDSCSAGLSQLMTDLNGDGWQIIKHNLNRNLADTTVHNIIFADYQTYPNATAVLLVGHIAVPYSGDLNPDGHPQHLGAWPADAYYGNMYGPWTDNSINDTLSSFPANRNKIGDGKFDQTLLPSANQLQVSRIDFWNMPVFGKTEIQLMNSYLNRDHNYKMDLLNIARRALIDDNFGAFSGEAFAANGWRIFPPMVSRDSIYSIDFITSLNDSSFEWAYGCGGGTFISAGGIGNDTNFANNSINGIFTMLFGSYFGDWNVQNNFLRSPLCSTTPALTCCWAGRPNWFMHHMALGVNIGYSALITQNNSTSLFGTLYNPYGYENNGVHVALMGDLSLRTDYIKQASNLSITNAPLAGAVLSWNPSPDPAVIGYYVYRCDSLMGNFQRVSPLISDTNFTDSFGTNGLKYYMLRPCKLQSTPSGTYYNLGIGITDSATISYYPTGIVTLQMVNHVSLFPNPTSDVLNMVLESQGNGHADIEIMDINGRKLMHYATSLKTGENSIAFRVSDLPGGMYFAVVNDGLKVQAIKWIKTH